MKKFISQNWYKMMLGTSCLMASFGFMIYAINPSYASPPKKSKCNTSVPLKTEEGITIKLSEEQLEKLRPAPVQKVVISGWTWKHNTSNIYGIGDEPLPVKVKK